MEESNNNAIIKYTHKDHFNLKSDWWKPKRWWCKWFGHKTVERMFNRSYFINVNGTDWRKMKDSQPVDYCERCKTVIAFESRFDAKSLEVQIAQMSVYEDMEGLQ